MKHKISRRGSEESLSELENLNVDSSIHPAQTPHILFSAENALHTPKVEMSHDEVLDALNKRGINFEEVQGKYGDPERSIMVLNPTHKQRIFVQDTAQKLGQDSIIHSDGKDHVYMYLNGEKAGKYHKGRGTQFHESEPMNDYTQMKDGSYFTHNIDFNHLHSDEINKNEINSKPKDIFNRHPREYYKEKKDQGKRKIIAERERKKTGAKKPLDAAMDRLKEIEEKKKNNFDKYEDMSQSELIDEEDLLEKTKPQYIGENHPSQPWQAKQHSLGDIMWAANNDQAARIDSFIRDRQNHERIMSKLPKTHLQAYKDMVNQVAKDPDRHFIPSQHGLGGEQKVRARHLKALLSGDPSIKIDTSDPSRLTIHRQSHTKGMGQPNISIHFPTKGSDEIDKGNVQRGVARAIPAGQGIEKSESRGSRATMGENRLGNKPDSRPELTKNHDVGLTFDSNKIINVLNSEKNLIKKKENITYDNWRHNSPQDIENEYNWEYKNHWSHTNLFPTLEHFQNAMKNAKILRVTSEDDQMIGNRSRTGSIDELKQLTSGYRYPRDVDAISNGFKNNDAIPHPIVIKHKGKYRVMSGNTRMDTAFIHGVEPKVALLDMDEALNKSEEDLMKGSLQRRNRFNPKSKENEITTSKQRRWTHDEEDDDRQTLPKMKGSARLRALNKLMAQTHVRKDPSTGERLFLMHRGMGAEEFNGSHSNGIAQYEKGVKTSWTPNREVADTFGHQSSKPALSDSSKRNRTVSAWIPESAIVHSVNQFNAPSDEAIENSKLLPKTGKKYIKNSRSITERDENEWVIEHNQPFHHANPRFTDRLNKDKLVSTWTKTNDSTSPDFKGEIGAKQFNATSQLAPEDKDQAYHNALNAKARIGSEDKVKKVPKLKTKLAASENTEPDLKKYTLEEMFNVLLIESFDLEKAADEDQVKHLPNSQELVDWSRKNIPNTSARTWYLGHIGKNPEAHEKLKDEMQHHGAMMGKNKHINAIQFNKKLGLEEGLNHLKNADKKWQEENKSDNLVMPDPENKLALKLNDNWAWYNLGKNKCDKESKAMGHCGTGGFPDTNLYSLRRIVKKGNKEYHEPHLTFEINPEGIVVQGKGKQNSKPNPKYHDAIMPLLLSQHVNHVIPSAYRPDLDFSLNDLSPEKKAELTSKKPDLDFFGTPYKEDGLVDRAANRYSEQGYNGLKNAARVHRDFSINFKNNTEKAMLSREGRNLLAKHPNVSPETLHALHQDEDPSVRRSVADHPNTSPETLHALHQDEKYYVRSSVADHPNVSPEILHALSQDKIPSVRRLVANHPNTSPETLHALHQDEDPSVRSSVAKHPNVSPETLHALHQDEDSYVRGLVADHPKYQEFLRNKKLAASENTEPDLKK